MSLGRKSGRRSHGGSILSLLDGLLCLARSLQSRLDMPVLTSPLARGVGAAHPQVVALEAQMRLRTSPGTPLPLMFKLHPSGALRGYESGERSPFCLGLCVSCSRSASLFKLHSRVARDARGGKSPPESLSLYGHLTEQLVRRRAASRSSGVESGLYPQRVSTCHACRGSLEASPAALLSQGASFLGFLL